MTHSQPNFVKTFTETASDEERQVFNNSVSSWAFLSERIMHGNPSGLDNTVCTFGNVVQFTKNPKRFLNVALKSPINIMLVNTGVSRNTSEIVRRVQDLKSIHTKLIDHIMDAMAVLVDDVVQVSKIQRIDFIIKLTKFSIDFRECRKSSRRGKLLKAKAAIFN